MHFITGNKNKIKEARSIFPDIEQLDIDLPEIQEIDAHTIIKAKLTEALRHHQDELIVEDTSLYFDCLNGLPGPLIKWFLKTMGNDGLATLAEKLGNNKAEAKTIIGYADAAGNVSFFEGAIRGTIVVPKRDTAFGWDANFLPDGHDKTFAEMAPDEKNSISMRRIALQKLKDHLVKTSA